MTSGEYAEGLVVLDTGGAAISKVEVVVDSPAGGEELVVGVGSTMACEVGCTTSLGMYTDGAARLEELVRAATEDDGVLVVVSVQVSVYV